MNTEKLKSLIENSDMATIQKNVTLGFINRAEADENKMNEDRQTIIKVTHDDRLSEILYSTDDVKIYSIYDSKDERDNKYPIRSIYKNENGTWRTSHTVAPTFEIAFLIYLEHKYLGNNSQFSEFVIKMLGIKIEE